jgi:hypothetical protein
MFCLRGRKSRAPSLLEGSYYEGSQLSTMRAGRRDERRGASHPPGPLEARPATVTCPRWPFSTGPDWARGAGASELPSVPTRCRRLELNRFSAPANLRSDLGKAFCAPRGRGRRCSVRFTSSERRWAGRPMTTRLEVWRLSTPRRNGAGRAERRREIWGITTPRTVTPGSIGRRCSGFLSCSFGPQRLPLDRSDAAGAFVEPAEATPAAARGGFPGAGPCGRLAASARARLPSPSRGSSLAVASAPAGSRARAPGGRSCRGGPARSTVLLSGPAANEV